MLFNSLDFLIFFPLVLLIYYLVPAKWSYLWLLAASYYFYMCWNPEYALLMLTSTAITFLSGILIAKFRDQSPAKAKMCVAGSFIANLAILAFFKYSPFVIDNINQIMVWMGREPSIAHFDILLPVGISFYTFQALSYTMDVYRRDMEPERNFLRYALFVSFFPQLVAGPIERSKDLLHQLQERKPLEYERFVSGFGYMLWGFFLKLVISDRAAIMVNHVYGAIDKFNGLELLIATIAFALQIYCDFNGYSCIALGASKILGIQLTRNFNTPYLSRSVAEFWRRWHISLSTWFRDYLYIPLGGNRKGRLRRNINLMIVFLTSGLWHGASWHFVVWGGLNGLYQVIGDLLRPVWNRIWKLLRMDREHPLRCIWSMGITFVLILSTWVFFRAETVPQAMQVIGGILKTGSWSAERIFKLGLNFSGVIALVFSTLILAAASIMNYRRIDCHGIFMRLNPWLRALVCFVFLWFILIIGIYGKAYDASSFLYFQF